MNRTIQHFWELLISMTEKELRARYKYTIFGFLWLLINPILQMLVIGFIFTFFMKEPVAHYYFYLFIGLLVWNFFSLSLSKTTPCIVNERGLIKKARFPRATIPLSIIVSDLVNFLLAILLYTIAVLTIGTLTWSHVPYILFALFLVTLFTIGISLLTSALNVRFRDVNFFVQAALIVWFYATPIVYVITVVPYKYIWLWRLNPLTSVVQLFQYGFLNAPPPGIAMLTANIITAVAITTLGIIIFRRESKNFDDWV
jgi:ABC-type polysaccharide/polyol phosphate export permease